MPRSEQPIKWRQRHQRGRSRSGDLIDHMLPTPNTDSNPLYRVRSGRKSTDAMRRAPVQSTDAKLRDRVINFRAYRSCAYWSRLLAAPPGRASWSRLLVAPPGRAPWSGLLLAPPGRAPWSRTWSLTCPSLIHNYVITSVLLPLVAHPGRTSWSRTSGRASG